MIINWQFVRIIIRSDLLFCLISKMAGIELNGEFNMDSITCHISTSSLQELFIKIQINFSFSFIPIEV